jgi:hypothetical protein
VGAIQARGRAGTFVRDVAEPTRPTRYLGIAGAPTQSAPYYLSTGTPDPALVLGCEGNIERFTSGATAWTSSYLDEPVLPALHEHLEKILSLSLTADRGRHALDALSRIVDQIVASAIGW